MKKNPMWDTVTAARNNTFFAGANTGAGFVSVYGDVLDEERFDKIYIIKGGPGTGKSYEMKRCIARAEAGGASATEYRCGSDPASVDMAVMEANGRRVAVLDGTAPHTYDPKYAGAVSEIMDFGAAWDADMLSDRRAEITELSKEKKARFCEAYGLLASALEMRRAEKRLTADAVRDDKMIGAAARLLREIGGKAGAVHRCYTHGITMAGTVCLDTFDRIAETRIAVSDEHGTGTFFLEALFDGARSHGIGVTAALSPMGGDDIMGLYFPGSAVWVTTDISEGDRTVNMLRFLDAGVLSRTRQKRRFYMKSREALIGEATVRLGEAKKCHFALEKIYGEAMDYSVITDIGRAMAVEIASILRV